MRVSILSFLCLGVRRIRATAVLLYSLDSGIVSFISVSIPLPFVSRPLVWVLRLRNVLTACRCLRLAAISTRAPPAHSSHCLCHCLCLAAIVAIASTAHPSHCLCHCLRLATINAHLCILLIAFVFQPSVWELCWRILPSMRELWHPSDCLRHFLRLAAISARASLVFSSHLSFLWARSSTLLCCLILSREFYPLPATCDIWCCHIYSTGALISTKLLVIIIVVSKNGLLIAVA